jgi:hypothetical protein
MIITYCPRTYNPRTPGKRVPGTGWHSVPDPADPIPETSTRYNSGNWVSKDHLFVLRRKGLVIIMMSTMVVYFRKTTTIHNITNFTLSSLLIKSSREKIDY